MKLSQVALVLLTITAVACTDSQARLENASREYVEDNADALVEAGFDLDEFRGYVVSLCETLDTHSDPDRYLAIESGSDYWFWSDGSEPRDERNSADEPIVIAREACNFDPGGALKVGLEMFSGTSPSTVRGLSEDPLDQMEIAFIGDYRRSEIKRVLDHAMELYDLPIDDDNYRRAGSILVALRQDFGPSEMEILDYMIRSHVPEVEVSFAEGAALAVSFLSVGDQ